MNHAGGPSWLASTEQLGAITRWSLVRRASTNALALDEWIRNYWFCFYGWARRSGWSPEDAADAVQDFLSDLVKRDLLARADPSLGRLRGWLLACFSNHLANRRAGRDRLKRGGAARHISLHRPEAEAFYESLLADCMCPQRAFDRAWALSLLEEAVAKLASVYRERGQERLFELLLPSLESRPEDTHSTVAQLLEMTPSAVRQATVRLRQRFRQILIQLAAERLGTTTESQLREELDGLLGP